MGLLGVFKKKSKTVPSDQDKSLNKPKKEKKEKPVVTKEKTKSSEDLTIQDIKSSSEIKDKKGKIKKVDKHDTKLAYKILIRPLITEKATHLKAQNKYLFAVAKPATKNEIKKAVFHVYGYWPAQVNIINLGGKQVRYGRSTGTTKSWKKAIVTLKSGDSIEIYEGV